MLVSMPGATNQESENDNFSSLLRVWRGTSGRFWEKQLSHGEPNKVVQIGHDQPIDALLNTFSWGPLKTGRLAHFLRSDRGKALSCPWHFRPINYKFRENSSNVSNFDLVGFHRAFYMESYKYIQ